MTENEINRAIAQCELARDYARRHGQARMSQPVLSLLDMPEFYELLAHVGKQLRLEEAIEDAR